jgi:hypothetical protein
MAERLSAEAELTGGGEPERDGRYAGRLLVL